MVKPKSVRANSARDVADLSAQFGVYLDDWQVLILEAAMGERVDTTWAAKRVGISVPRQNGKSQLMVARILAGALLFGEKKIVVSAHQQDTAREAFAKLMEIIEADQNAALRARLDRRFGRDGVMNAINRESVRFTTGATVQFKARSGAGAKGFSSDCLLLDEAQILGSRAWTSVNSTMSAMVNPQVWLLGTPPQEEDDSFAFDAVRRAAVEKKSTNAAWCEWAVDVESEEYEEARSDLESKRWTPAVEYLCWSGNPAWNTRINHEVVTGEFETYDRAKFEQDRLGIWSDPDKVSIFPTWPDLVRKSKDPVPKVEALGIMADAARTWLSLGSYGGGHVGAVERMPFVSARSEFVAKVTAAALKHGLPVAVQEKTGAELLAPALEANGVSVHRVPFAAMVRGVDLLAESVATGTATHGDYDALNAAVRVAEWKLIGDQRVFDHKAGDVSMLEAVALAWHIATAPVERELQPFALWG